MIHPSPTKEIQQANGLEPWKNDGGLKADSGSLFAFGSNDFSNHRYAKNSSPLSGVAPTSPSSSSSLSVGSAGSLDNFPGQISKATASLQVQIPSSNATDVSPSSSRRFSQSLPVSPKNERQEEEEEDVPPEKEWEEEPFGAINNGLIFLPKSDSYEEFKPLNGPQRRDSLGPYPPQFNPNLLFDDEDGVGLSFGNVHAKGMQQQHNHHADSSLFPSSIHQQQHQQQQQQQQQQQYQHQLQHQHRNGAPPNGYPVQQDQRFQPSSKGGARQNFGDSQDRDPYGYIGGAHSAPNLLFPSVPYGQQLLPQMQSGMPMNGSMINSSNNNSSSNGNGNGNGAGHVSFSDYLPSWSAPNVMMYNSQSLPDEYLNSDLGDPWQQYPQPEEAIVDGKTMTVCRYFRHGYCRRGSRCKFPHIHGDSDLPPSGLSPLQHSPVMNGMSPPSMNGLDSSRSMLKTGGLQPPNGAGLSSVSRGGARKAHKRSQSEGPKYPPLEMLQGRIYSLCKDQHGCRYLQKKLEEERDSQVELIFDEAYDHMLELMEDPFGNYLCQKLFGYCNMDQKTRITRKVSPGLVRVSLNMHGTRSVQKLIDCLTTDEQISMIVDALKDNVVLLIKDLNGNHVIQKCLHRLTPEQNQFIYDAVTANCVSVASHRHGCCVLQRCIDHASEAQQIQLATEITFHALALVQDAFGNYVVQYILDLKSERFTDALIRRFLGHVYKLSFQKFSSNVIEKCIRVAQPDTRRGLIQGLLDKDKLPMMLQDQYANYVIQTSLDVAEPYERNVLCEMIRPLLNNIRHLPYCKRIQSRILKDSSAPFGGMPPQMELTLPHGYSNYLPMPTPTPIQPAPLSAPVSASPPETLANSMMNLQLNRPLSPVGNRSSSAPNRKRAAT